MKTGNTDNPTDLSSLRMNHVPPPIGLPEPGPRGLSDWAVDLLIPIMIFLMMLSVTFFLLDIRFVYTEKLDLNMRTFAFFFVLGIVALNRVRADRADGAGVYMVGMVFAVGVFSIVSHTRGGGMAGGYMANALLSIAFNISVVIILWKVTDRLTRDCCMDLSSRSGDEGLMRGGWFGRKPTAPLPDPLAEDPGGIVRPPRKHPANSLFYLAIPIMGLLALGQRILPQGGSFLDAAGSVYVGVYTASMLMLLFLSSYRGFRVYCQQRRIDFPTGLAAFWLGLGTLMVALVFILGLWGPVPRTTPRAEHLTRLYDADGRTISDSWDYHEHERTGDGSPSSSASDEESQEGSDNDEGNGEGGPEHDPNASEGPHDGGDSQGGNGPGEGQGSASGQQQQGQDGSEGQGQEHREGGESSPDDGEAQTGKKDSQNPPSQQNQQQQAQRRMSPPNTEVPMNELMKSFPALKWLGYGALVIVALFILYAVFQAAAHFFGKASKRPSRFAGFLARLSRFFRRLTQVPKRKPRRARVKIDHDIATCARYHNPVESAMALREKIQYSYDALCALAYDLGVPRDDDQTPFEFLAELPEPIEALRNEAQVLTYHYVAGSYSTLPIPPSVLEDLRVFWRKYERMRGKVLR